VSTRLWLSLVMLVMGGGLLTATGLAGPGQQRGGTLRIARSSDIGSLDPALAYTPDTSAIEFAICAKLHSYPDKPGREGAIVIPEVAEGFPTVSRTEGRRRSSSSAAAASRVVWTIGVGPEACRIAIERAASASSPSGIELRLLRPAALHREIERIDRLSGEARAEAWADLDVELMRNDPAVGPCRQPGQGRLRLGELRLLSLTSPRSVAPTSPPPARSRACGSPPRLATLTLRFSSRRGAIRLWQR
jgi:hypothetical protein